MGIGININTLPLVTVGVGFGIDYGLYILSRIIEEIRVTGDLDESIRHALVHLRQGGELHRGLHGRAARRSGRLSNIRFNAVMGGLLAIWMGISFVASVTLMPVLICVLRGPKFIMKEAARGHRREDHRADRGRGGELGDDMMAARTSVDDCDHDRLLGLRDHHGRDHPRARARSGGRRSGTR